MKLSNNAADDPFDSSSPGTSGLAVRKKPGRLLWAASARDEDGELLDMEILDLTESPPLPHVQHPTKVVESLDDSVQILEQPLPPSPTKEPRAIKETSPPSPGAEVQRDVGNSIFDLTDSSADTKLKFPPAPRSAITKALVEEIPEPNDTNWDDDLDFELPPSNQEHHELLLTQSSSPQVSFSVATSNQKLTWPSNIPSDKAPALPSSLSPPTKSMAPPRPKYELFTDAQLARDVAKFGFKPVKKRSAMLALLDQCWASRGQPAVGDVAMNAHMMSTTSATPTHSKLTTTAAPLGPAGRPRKSSGTAAASVDYGSLKVPDLKKLLQERSLKQSGNKPDLIARLQDYDLQRRTSAGGPSSPRGKPRKDAPSSPKKTKSPTRRAASPRLAGSPASTPRNKKSQGRTATIEIPDSDADSDLDDPMLSSPISPARRARPRDDEDIFSSPPRVDLSITEDAEMSLIASPTTEQVSVFAYITKAIKSAPPSRDPMDPSWHEKILMYDPIILEDLASWLNAGQLDKAGFDGEVSPADVKQWCESKGVCCLWRVSLRGLERKRL
ncbi:Slx4 endonuclease-domain-containing protein [Triangularia verruculosa]|uniref:Structure-specific endonuclease subunit SLX4 n=1 Tax=Triangularia verruculosa TaxID=2587418 RepID=A0AAN6XMC9_9PEZI|nr:Slx4 endonuclease-domain-containing protein [Triangularia verruculosa]